MAEFLKNDPDRVSRILTMAKAPLRASVNATRWALFDVLNSFGLPIEAASGGRTKYNSQRVDLPKTHAFDATCVGRFQTVSGWKLPILQIKCTGRGSYQRTRLTAGGFPRGYLMPQVCFWISDRRPGLRPGDNGQEPRPLCGKDRSASQRLVQHPNRRRRRSGYLAPALQSVAARRRMATDTIIPRCEAFREGEGQTRVAGVGAARLAVNPPMQPHNIVRSFAKITITL